MKKYTIVISDRAIEHLRSIYLYYLRIASPEIARRIHADILKKIMSLSFFLNRFKEIVEGKGVRMMSIYRLVVAYTVLEDFQTVIIHFVVSGFMDINQFIGSIKR